MFSKQHRFGSYSREGRHLGGARLVVYYRAQKYERRGYSEGTLEDLRKELLYEVFLFVVIYRSKYWIFVLRYDYEECDCDAAASMMDHLENLLRSGSLIGKQFSSGGKSYTVSVADNFSYKDPIDNTVTKNQVFERVKVDLCFL